MEEEPKMKSTRTGIWIPAWIENLKLPHTQTKLLAEIVSLHEKGSCFASNAFFAELLDLKQDTVSRLISELKKKGLIKQTGFDGRKRYLVPTYNSDLKPMETNEGFALEKNPTPKRPLPLKEVQESVRKESNPGLETNVSLLYSTKKIQTNVQLEKSWNLFKTWTKEHLTYSTQEEINRYTWNSITNPKVQMIWENWKFKNRNGLFC